MSPGIWNDRICRFPPASLVRPEGSHSYGQAEDSFPFFRSERDDALQLADEWIEISVWGGEHDGSSFTREHI
jgi:hypothetical protein